MYTPQQHNTPRRIAGLIAVVVLHVGFFYALTTGLGHTVIEVVRPLVEAKIIEDVKPPEPPPPPPPQPKMTALPPPYIPLPDIRVEAPPPDTAITAVTVQKPEAPAPIVRAPEPAPVKTEPAVVAAVIDAASCRKPDYPRLSNNRGEQGTVRLRFLLDEDGQVIESVIDDSSGSHRLDEAARAGLSLCQFKPVIIDGKPQRTWATLNYTWKLPD